MGYDRKRWAVYREARHARARQCVVVMCDGREEARGLCAKHYKRWRKHGVLYSPKALAGLRDRNQRARDYYWEHRDERLAYQRALRDADPDAARERERAVYRRNRAKHQARNRARERGLGNLDAESLTYDSLLRLDPCSYCGATMQHVDHIVPVVAGGDNHWSNLTAACQPCNRSKSSDALLAFLWRTP